MATTGNFPTSHTTTTTTSTTRITIAPCRLDCSYSTTIPGILKIIQIALSFLSFLCCVASPWYPYGGWHTFVTVIAYITTGLLLLLYVFHLIERSYMCPWLLIEFIYCAVWTFFYLLAASMTAAKAGSHGGLIAAAFFAFLALAAYGYDAWIKFRGWRAGDIAQGEKHVTTTTAPTAY